MANNNDTPLNQLPNNSLADSDLVNKILNQLDESSTTDVPAMEETVSIEEMIEPQVVQSAPVLSQPRVYTPNVPIIVNNQRENVKRVVGGNNMPTPGSVQKFLGLFDTPEFYYKLKISIFCVILFMVFVLFKDNFKIWFSKLPIQTMNAMGEMNNTGLFLQASCFGILHLGFTIFFDGPK